MRAIKIILCLAVIFQSCSHEYYLVQSNSIEITYREYRSKNEVMVKLENKSDDTYYINNGPFFKSRIIKRPSGLHYTNIYDYGSVVFPMEVEEFLPNQAFIKRFKFGKNKDNVRDSVIYLRIGYFENIDSCFHESKPGKESKIIIDSDCSLTHKDSFKEFDLVLGKKINTSYTLFP